MANKYLEKLAGLGINPLKPMGLVAAQAGRIENKAIKAQLTTRTTGGSAARMQQLGQRRAMAGTIKINAQDMIKKSL